MRSNGEIMALVRRNGILVWVPWNEPAENTPSQQINQEETVEKRSDQSEETEEE